MKKLKQYLVDSNKKTFLDVGTAGGSFISIINELYPDFEKCVGIDTIQKAIEAATKNNSDKRISFLKMDALSMDFADESFDVVCLSNTLHHLYDIPAILKEMRRVVKKDGFILINEMMSSDLNDMQLSHLKLHHFAAKIDRLNGETHFDTFSRDEILKKLVKDTDLNLIDSWDAELNRRTSNTQEELDYIFKVMDRVMLKVPNEKQEFTKEVEDIKQYIMDKGYDGATSLIAILAK